MNSDETLYQLTKIATEKPDYVFDRVYRYFYNADFYRAAWQQLKLKRTAGQSREEIPSSETLEQWTREMKDESYQPQGLNRGRVSDRDRIVLEICSMLLRAIFRPHLHDSNPGLVPGRSCHHALHDAKTSFQGATWLLAADYNPSMGTIPRDKLFAMLEQRIKDAKFIRLLRKLLRAGYMQEFAYGNTYSGTPQGSEFASWLSSIYWHSFDQWCQRYTCKTSETASSQKLMRCVRYGGAFAAAVWGTRKDCEGIQQELEQFLAIELGLTTDLTSERPIKMAHVQEGVPFLGHIIKARENREPSGVEAWDDSIGSRGTNRSQHKGKFSPSHSRAIELYMPENTIRKFIIEYKLVKDIDAKTWRMQSLPFLIRRSDTAIVQFFNAQLQGLYSFFRMSANVSRYMGQLRHVMEYSCLATLAAKHQISISMVKQRFAAGKHWGIRSKDNQGRLEITYFFNESFVRSIAPEAYCDHDPDIQPKAEAARR